MDEVNKTMRLNKVLRELNISLDKAVNYLVTKGHDIDPRPTTKISSELYKVLLDGFPVDRNKIAAFRGISQERRKEKENIRAELEEKLKKTGIREEAKAKFEANSTFPLNYVLKELNISLNEARELLKSKGFNIELRPITKISSEVYKVLLDGFKTTKSEKVLSTERIDLKKFERPRRIVSDIKNNHNENTVFKSRQQIEQELKEFWNIDKFKFIASVSGSGNNVQFLRNIRKENGERLTYPDGSRISIMVPKGAVLNINDEYLIEVFIAPDDKRKSINNNYLFFLDTENNVPKRYSVPTKDYVNKLKGQYERAEGIARDTIIGSLRRLTAETNRKPETFIFELIQNADDYPDPKNNDVHVSFHITNNHLVLTHNGLPFQQKNVYAICTVDAGDKKDDLHKTGFKGIGFKSIFKFSNHVWISSGKYSFKFDQNYYQKKGMEMPWQVIPIWTDPANLDSFTKKLLKKPVSIFIRPTEGEQKLKEITSIFNSVFKNDDRVLLFLRHVKSISFNTSEDNFKIEQDSSKWEVSNLESIIIPEEVKVKLSKAADKDDRVPEKYKNVHNSKITFATSIKEGKIVKTENARLYAYLPTDWNFGFHFLINGDFIPDGSRDRLFDDIDWNLYLFEETGFSYLQWVANLVNEYQSPAVFDIFPNMAKLLSQEKDRAKLTFLNVFNTGLQRAFNEIPFILDTTNKLQLLSNVLFDKTGFLFVLPEEIKDILVGDLKLIDFEFSKHSTVGRLIREANEDAIFDYSDLKENIDVLVDWLIVPENNILFLNHLIKNNQHEEFLEEAIILTSSNVLAVPSGVYFEIPESDLLLLPFLELNILHKDLRFQFTEENNLNLKCYQLDYFINDEIITIKEEIDTEIQDSIKSVKFYTFLAQYVDELADNTIKELKWFRHLDSYKEDKISIEDSNLYFVTENIKSLLESNCLPKNQIIQLPEEYLEHPNGSKLWQRFGVKTITANNIATFIQDEVCGKLNEINGHLEELFESESKKIYRVAKNELIDFLEGHLVHLTRENIEKLKYLLLFLDEDFLEPFIDDMNIYIEEEITLQLFKSKCFPHEQIRLLPNNYLTTKLSKPFWKGLGVKSVEESTFSNFIQEEITAKVNEINKHWNILFESKKEEYNDASKVLYKFLVENQNLLTTNDYEQIKDLELFKNDDNVESCLSACDFYFEEASILKLINNKCFPIGNLSIIPQEYLKIEKSELFWDKAGVKQVNVSNVAEFIVREFCDNIKSINEHLKSLLDESEISYINAITEILIFLKQNETNISDSETEQIKEKLSVLYILTSEDILKELKDCYISSEYTGKSDIEELINSFPEVELSFISNKFLLEPKLTNKDWSKLFASLGAKDDHFEFVKNSLIPHFENINEDNIIAATKLLFESRVFLEKEFEKMTDFPVLTHNGIVNAEEAVLGYHYLEEGDIKIFLQQFQLNNEISNDYTESKIEEWTGFFQKRGVPKVNSESLISQGINLLLGSEQYFESDDKHNKLIKLLLKLHESGSLTDANYLKLQNLKISVKSESTRTEFLPAKDILFSNEYDPAIRFEDYQLENSLHYLSEKYILIEPEESNLKKFFKKIGVVESFVWNKLEEKKREEIQENYLSYINEKHPLISNEVNNFAAVHKIKPWIEVPFLNLILNRQINKEFWNLIAESIVFRNSVFDALVYQKRHSSENVKNYPTWFIIKNLTVLNLAGDLKIPIELYNTSLREVIKDDSKVSSLDMSLLEIKDNRSIAEILGVKTVLDLKACLNILERKESINWLRQNNILSRLEEVLKKGLDENELEILESFIQSGQLPAQTKVWVPIQKLHYVDPSFKLGITKSPWIIHSDFKKLYKYFKLNTLNEDDFKFDTKSKSIDYHLKSRLQERSKYLAFLLFQEEGEWKEKTLELNKIIKVLNFYNCKKIALSYKNEKIEIENNDFNFYFLEENDFYYIGKWDNVRAAEMYPQLYNRLKLENPVSEKVFIDILLADRLSDILDFFEEKNIEVPEELNPNKREREQIDENTPEPPKEEEETEEETEHPKETISQDNKEADDVKKDTPSTINDSQKENQEGKDSNENDNNSSKIEYSQEEDETLKRLFGNEVPKDFHKDLNLAALIKALVFLTKEGYDTTVAESNLAETHVYSQLSPVFLAGEEFTIMARSAKSGLLHIQVNAWNRLEQSNIKLFVTTGNTENSHYFFNNKEEILKISDTKYQVFRVEAESLELNTDSFLKGDFEKDKIWLILKMVDKVEYKLIFGAIRDLEDAPEF
jgi:hypothetical protein